MSTERIKGRGAAFNPPNRFEQLQYLPLEVELDYEDERPPFRTQFYGDTSRTILAKNDSPDISFTYSINPYRGCEHGCVYCYARPSHEYLGFSAGLDFESKIMVKRDAPRLLEEALRRKSWVPQTVAISGNTDCYQPAERLFRLTRRCLEVFQHFRNPVGIITKNALILRDIDILQEMARLNIVHVLISMITLDPDLVRKMEPRTATPPARLHTISELARHGIPVGLNLAPVIPGLTDQEIPALLKAAADNGATTAAFSPVRLPGAVEPLFVEWIQRTFPDRAEKVLHRIRNIHEGRLNDSRFGSRMTGKGEFAKVINDLFALHASRYHLDDGWEELTTKHYRRDAGGQGELF
jgi:DNA repair photolyase